MKDREDNRSDSSQPGKGEFSAAMSRLEKAVQEVVDVTAGELTGRATTLIDDTSRRLEAELRLRRAESDSPEVAEASEQRRRRRRFRHRFDDRRERFTARAARLYRDPSDEKIAGVCAGIARYFGMETWIVRMGALTGLIFLPGIVFPAYWIAYFIMDKKPTDEGLSSATDSATEVPGKRESSRARRRRERREHREARAGAEPSARRGFGNNGGLRGPEQEPASRSLRHTMTDLTQAELRLRRIESFVTSDRYELQKELHKIENESGERHDRTAP